jgi:hypothetical protein
LAVQNGRGYGLDPDNLDLSVSPRDNFFQFSNGGWMSNPVNACPTENPSFSVDQHHHHVHTNTSLQARRTRTSQWALWLFYWCSIRAVMVPKHYCSDSEGGGARVREVGK